jgi:dTDP-4-dehydrorhamnose reductase
MKTILVTGANGQLGMEIQNIASDVKKFNFIFTDIPTLDITNEIELSAFFEKNKIDYIVNCAAYTAVDKAEENEKLCTQINNNAVKNLVEFSKEYKIKFITISTDYVFNGKSYIPYTEESETSPNSVYGNSKRNGEIVALSYENSIIIRTSWLYSHYGNNFVKTMLELSKKHSEIKVIFDQIGTPTYAADLAEAIIEIIRFSEDVEFKSGIYNYSNEGVTSWYDFAKAIFRITKTNCKVKPIETKDYPTLAERPHYSILNKSKIKNTFNLFIPHWEDSLSECIKNHKK